MSPRLAVLCLTAGWLSACAKDAPPPSLVELAEKLPWTSVPRLPAPESGTYLAFRDEPTDEVVRELLRGKHYDGALASAGANIALDAIELDASLERWSLREALWRGGYPFPVYDARTWDARPGEPPPRDMLLWIEAVPADEPMAVVRARGAHGDVWAGLRAHPEVELDPLPRRTAPGAAVQLQPMPGARYRLADGSGRLFEGALDGGESLLLSSSGEWLLEITRDHQELVRLPIYVGVSPPDQPVLRVSDDAMVLNDAEDAEALALLVLDQVRRAYLLPAWRPEPGLSAAASKVAASPASMSDRIIEALGYDRPEVTIWTCDDVTVQNCVDRWLWDPARRATLLGNTHKTLGVHAELDARGVHLTMLLGRES